MNGHRTVVTRLLPLLAALVLGCDFPGRPNSADEPVPANKVLKFDALYAIRCAGCHGADGKLGPAPPLNDPLFLALVPDTELLHVIAEGRTVSAAQKSPMPAFAESRGGPLTDAQVKVLAEGIKTRWGPPASPAEPPPYIGSVATGSGNKEVFARACAGCHGKDGEGIERDGKLHRKIHDPAFLALVSDQELRRYVITGRPDLGMPAYDGKAGRPPDFRALTSPEIDGLAALLGSWRQGGTANDK